MKSLPLFTLWFWMLCFESIVFAQGIDPSIKITPLKETASKETQLKNTPSNISQVEKLSDWLLKNPVKEFQDDKPYSIGMSWFVPMEAKDQEKIKQQVLNALEKIPTGKFAVESTSADGIRKRTALAKTPDTIAKERLLEFINNAPLTGRVLLPNQDPRYLELHPKQDPILMPGDRLSIPTRPTTITVIRSDGSLCKVRHRALVPAYFYVQACQSEIGRGGADWAWIIEPDGIIKKVPTASWNAAAQPDPAPGSWIWAPPRSSIWNSKEGKVFTNEWVHFLATQAISGQEFGLDQNAKRSSLGYLSDHDIYAIERDLPISANLWGGIGLLQTPTARFSPAGTGTISMGWYQPYTNLNFTLAPTDWFEFAFRYTNINNIPYGATISGQTYKDKSIDFKLRLTQESYWLPGIALGARDFVGTGLFSGEYLVANKRYRDFDASLGIGWGSLGTRNNIRNPLIAVSPNFMTRPPPQTNEGGTTGSYYFHGASALFGGVQYHTPWDKLVLKLEVDGNNYYKDQPFNNSIAVKSIFNFGAVYQTKNIDWTAGVMGNKLLVLSISLHERLDQLNTPKLGEAKPVPAQLKPVGNYVPPLYQAKYQNTTSAGSISTSTVTSLSEPSAVPTSGATVVSNSVADTYRATLLEIETQTGWQVKHLRQVNQAWLITFINANGFYLRNRFDRAIAVLHRDAPPSITRFDLRLDNWGMVVSEFKVDRRQWMLGQTQLLPNYLRKPDIEVEASAVNAAQNRADALRGKTLGELDARPALHQEFGFSYAQLAGGPDTQVLFAIFGKSDAIYKFNESTWVSNTINVRLVDNFGKFQYDGPTNLQPVRTDIRQYMTTSIATMPNLQITKTGKFGENHFVSGYGGYLEMMFAGAGAEYLYRPAASRFAVGVNVNRVRQRQFNQWTSLQSYSVNTGHVTGYWDTGIEDILLKLSLGQYLAGDRGGTLDISKIFQNGVKIGAYATITNVSAQQYGEGSFDKGIYVAIPFDAFFTKHSDSSANILWTPLIRDGGQMLYRKYQLYDMTRTRDNRALQTGNSDGRIGDVSTGPDGTLAY